jgi:hypothetical protein
MLQKRLGRMPTSYDNRRFRRDRPIVVTQVDAAPQSAQTTSTPEKAAPRSRRDEASQPEG